MNNQVFEVHLGFKRKNAHGSSLLQFLLWQVAGPEQQCYAQASFETITDDLKELQEVSGLVFLQLLLPFMGFIL